MDGQGQRGRGLNYWNGGIRGPGSGRRNRRASDGALSLAPIARPRIPDPAFWYPHRTMRSNPASALPRMKLSASRVGNMHSRGTDSPRRASVIMYSATDDLRHLRRVAHLGDDLLPRADIFPTVAHDLVRLRVALGRQIGQQAHRTAPADVGPRSAPHRPPSARSRPASRQCRQCRRRAPPVAHPMGVAPDHRPPER